MLILFTGPAGENGSHRPVQTMYFGRGVITWWRLVLVHGVAQHRAAMELWGWSRG